MDILLLRRQHASTVCILHVTLVCISALEASVLIDFEMHGSFQTTPVGH
jgi:hypothetical protein